MPSIQEVLAFADADTRSYEEKRIEDFLGSRGK